jgi:hypothetical protein
LRYKTTNTFQNSLFIFVFNTDPCRYILLFYLLYKLYDQINFVCNRVVSYKCLIPLNFQENVHRIKSNEKVDINDEITLDDYNLIDPSPGATKNLHPGEFQHETPLIPFIPKSPPPSPP